ncbi:MAG TPA: hypothetical protein ENI39_02725 [Anaerolineae bacterium]|nr:hypothetical protein [Anaerolineae bacterium]
MEHISAQPRKLMRCSSTRRTLNLLRGASSFWNGTSPVPSSKACHTTTNFVPSSTGVLCGTSCPGFWEPFLSLSCISRPS